MKQLLYLFVVILFLLCTESCQQKNDDYYTQAFITLQAPDNVTPLKIQGTIVLKNLSNGRRYATSDFKNNTISIELLRGPYMLEAEGTLLCRMPDGKEEVKYYRASQDYIEIVEHPVKINTEIIFM